MEIDDLTVGTLIMIVDVRVDDEVPLLFDPQRGLVPIHLDGRQNLLTSRGLPILVTAVATPWVAGLVLARGGRSRILFDARVVTLSRVPERYVSFLDAVDIDLDEWLTDHGLGKWRTTGDDQVSTAAGETDGPR